MQFNTQYEQCATQCHCHHHSHWQRHNAYAERACMRVHVRICMHVVVGERGLYVCVCAPASRARFVSPPTRPLHAADTLCRPLAAAPTRPLAPAQCERSVHAASTARATAHGPGRCPPAARSRSLTKRHSASRYPARPPLAAAASRPPCNPRDLYTNMRLTFSAVGWSGAATEMRQRCGRARARATALRTRAMCRQAGVAGCCRPPHPPHRAR